MSESESLPQSLHRYLMVLRRQWWVTAVVTIIAIGAAVGYVEQAKPVYSSSMKLVVGQGETLFAPGQSADVQPFTQTITDLLQSQIVAKQTIAQRGLHTTPASLLGNLKVSTGPTSSVMTVSYDDTSRHRAVAVLSTLGTIFTNLVDTTLARTATRTVPGQAAQPVSVAIFDPAHPDPGQVSPRVGRTLAIVGILGLIAGVLLAFLRDALSGHIRNEEEAEASYGAPVIGAVPRGTLGLTIGQLDAIPPKLGVRMGEAFQLLTSRLRYSTDLKRGVIVVIGARPEDGKSTVTAHMSAVLARAGNNVIAVEADLHRPALHRLLDAEPGLEGLRDLDQGGSKLLVSALVPIHLKAGRAASSPARRPAVVGGDATGEDSPETATPGAAANGEVELDASSGRLRLLPAGVATGNPMNILSLGNASLLIATLRAVADYVVIDTPPLLRSADAYPFLQLADVVVAVCRERGTSQAEAHETRSILASLGVSRFSVVLSESTSAKSRYGYYGYGESET